MSETTELGTRRRHLALHPLVLLVAVASFPVAIATTSGSTPGQPLTQSLFAPPDPARARS